MSTPNSTLYVCAGVPLNNSYDHTLYFDGKIAQENYFLGKSAHTFGKYTFLRPEHQIKVVGDFVDAYSWNYLFFINGAGKAFFHFINKVEYVNDQTVVLHIELDLIQTFMFDWNLHECLIERTHTLTDGFGEHTVPEGLEMGPLIRYMEEDVWMADCYIMMLASCDAHGNGVWGRMYGGAYSGLACYAIEPANLTQFNLWLKKANDEGFIDAIVSMWMYPKNLVNTGEIAITGTDNSTVAYYVSDVKTYQYTASNPFQFVQGGHYPEMLNGVQVQNNKVFCYPFTQLYVTNNMGGCAVFHRERFEDPDNIQFKLFGALSPEGGVKMAPEHYKLHLGDSVNFEEGITMPPYPSCAWNGDVYKVWLAQNMATQQATIQQSKVNAAIGVGSMVAGIVAGIATKNPMTVVGGVVAGGTALKNTHNTIQNIMAQREDMAVQPDQARGHNSASINLTNGRMGFSLYWMCPTPEYIQEIDSYFTHYGYKVNQFGVPSLKNRERYTYIKTAGAFVTGPFGADHQQKIQEIFDHGITFWVEPNKVGNYADRNVLL